MGLVGNWYFEQIIREYHRLREYKYLLNGMLIFPIVLLCHKRCSVGTNYMVPYTILYIYNSLYIYPTVHDIHHEHYFPQDLVYLACIMF